jgi:hypothetical protein
MTFKPSPTGAVSVTGGGAGAGAEPPHEAQAMKTPAAGSSRSFLMERLPRWRGDGWVVMEWNMMLMGLGDGIVLIEMEKPDRMNAGLFAGGIW